jgi:hypothetical protein
MQDRVTLFRLPAWAQDLLLALFITVMQVQGTVIRNSGELESVLRPLADLGHLGYILLVAGGVAVAVRRRWPVTVFATTALASLAYALDSRTRMARTVRGHLHTHRPRRECPLEEIHRGRSAGARRAGRTNSVQRKSAQHPVDLTS